MLRVKRKLNRKLKKGIQQKAAVAVEVGRREGDEDEDKDDEESDGDGGEGEGRKQGEMARRIWMRRWTSSWSGPTGRGEGTEA